MPMRAIWDVLGSDIVRHLVIRTATGITFRNDNGRGNCKTRIVLHNKAKMAEKAEFTQRK